MLKPVLAGAGFAIIAAGGAMADFKSSIDETGKGLVYFDAACEDAFECETAALRCPDEGDLFVTLDGFSARGIGEWIERTGGTATLLVNDTAFHLRVVSTEWSALDGTWAIVAEGMFKTGQMWSTILSGVVQLQIDTPSGPLDLLPRDPGMLRQIAEACLP